MFSRAFLGKIIKLSFLVTIAFFSVDISLAQDSPKLVEGLDVQGNRRLRDKDILAHIETRLGETFNKKQLEKDLDRLLSLEVFDPMNSRVIVESGIRGGVNVIFEVMELPIIDLVSYEFPESLSVDAVKRKLKEQGLLIIEGQVYQVEKLRKVRKAIRRYLAVDGHEDMDVLVFEEALTATTLKLTFKIERKQN